MALIDSPSLRATSAIERSIIVVEIGNSTESPATPKQPPTPPQAAIPTLCLILDDYSPGISFIVNIAASDAFNKAA